ncbi:MAG TPA: thiol:disulfide interchange protein DsbG [Gammaproteobacteria bacterium]|nr:thiol:disulfide interchange protein DsbG [Gammaproteobacteria bacterium]
MKNRTLACLILLFLLSGSSLVSATTAVARTAARLPAALAPLARKLDFVVLRTFKTDAPEITGFVVKDGNGRFGVVYTYKNFLISGSLLDARGTNLTPAYAAKYIPKPDYAAVVKTLADSPGLVSEGKRGAPEVYVFADPNCYYCRKLWEETRAWVRAGKIRLHWAMVGFLKHSSTGRAAAILAAADGAKTLTEDEVRFDLKNEEGGIAELKPVPEKYRKILHKHLVLMQELHFQGTPGVVFKDVHGHWQGSPGVPKLDQLAKTLGISQ